MTDHNTNDPLPEDENLGSAGSPHSTERNLHQRSDEFYESEQELPPASCEVCEATIPPTHSRCPDHRTESAHNAAGESDWSISNIGLVIVEASSKFAALANASVAFRRRDGAPGTDDSYDLIYDFGDPSETLTSDWGGELPDATELDSPLGETLYDRAIEKMNAGDSTSENKTDVGGIEFNSDILHQDSSSNAYLFTEYGKAISDEDQLDAFKSASSNPDHEQWLVPAVLYKRNETPTNTLSETKECVNCGVSQHKFEGPVKDTSVTRDKDIGVWICLECGSKKADAMPKHTAKGQTDPNDEAPTEGEKSIKKAEQDQFNSVMERLDANDDLSSSPDTE